MTSAVTLTFPHSTDATTLTLAVTSKPYNDDINRVRVAYFYCLALILPVGIICNVLCVGVFVTSNTLRRSTTAQYLVVMAAADTLFLIGEMMRWSSQKITGQRVMHESDVACKMTHFLRYSGKLISAWLTVVITAERFLSIAFPLVVKHISTRMKARLTISTISAVGLGLGSFPLWTLHTDKWQGKALCQYKDKRMYDLWSHVVLRFGQLLIPSLLIFILTTLIIIFLARAGNRRAELFQFNGLRRKNVVRHVERQLTFMLLFVAITFLALRLPYCVTYYFTLHKETIWPEMTDMQKYHLYVANKIADILATINYAANFFLYCVSGSIFRQQITRIWPCMKKKQTRARSRSLTRSSMLSVTKNETRL